MVLIHRSLFYEQPFQAHPVCVYQSPSSALILNSSGPWSLCAVYEGGWQLGLVFFPLRKLKLREEEGEP